MAKHNVYLDLPLREVNKVDAHFIFSGMMQRWVALLYQKAV
ncbi:MAG: hypothetical protein ACR2KX_06680 [Chitinophagaceae bacterium]